MKTIDTEDLRFVAEFIDLLNISERNSGCYIEEEELSVILEGDLPVKIKRMDDTSWGLAI